MKKVFSPRHPAWMLTPLALLALAASLTTPARTQTALPVQNIWQRNGSAIYYNGGAVGIGTTSPLAPLEVRGGAGPTSFQVIPGNLFGVGTANAVTLDIAGVTGTMGVWDNLRVSNDLYVDGNVGIGNSALDFPLTFASVLGDKIALWGTAGNSFGFGIQPGLLQIHTNFSGSDIAFGYGPSDSMTETMRITGFGNVGIGTTSPGAKLDVSGLARMTGFTLTGNGAGAGKVLTSDASGNGAWQDLPAPPAVYWTASGNNIYNANSGNVGIGTSSPGAKLDVNGTARMTGLQVTTGAAAGRVLTSDASGGGTWQAPLTYWTASGNNLYNNNSGNVGIGTSSPNAKLDVNGTVRINDNDIYLRGGSDVNHGLGFYGTGKEFASVNVNGPMLYGDTGGALGTTNGGQKIALWWDFGGNVGIGTTSPGAKLEVRGGTGPTSWQVLPGSLFGTGTADAVTLDIPGVTGTLGVWDNLQVNGIITGAAKFFLIDHPLDPLNKTLRHACIESAEMKNLYDGVVITDGRGYANVTVPDWFLALNTDFRYQLTVAEDDDSDGFAQAKIARKMHGNQFVIRTSAPRTEVHWQITGVRQDAYAKAHPLIVEEDKPEGERGRYLHPEEHGQPAERSVNDAPAPGSHVEKRGGARK